MEYQCYLCNLTCHNMTLFAPALSSGSYHETKTQQQNKPKWRPSPQSLKLGHSLKLPTTSFPIWQHKKKWSKPYHNVWVTFIYTTYKEFIEYKFIIPTILSIPMVDLYYKQRWAYSGIYLASASGIWLMRSEVIIKYNLFS